MTYRGHIVNRYGMRCHFSPVATTGQKYIYTGHEKGQILSKFLNYQSINLSISRNHCKKLDEN